MGALKRVKLNLSASVVYLLSLLDVSTVSEEPECSLVILRTCPFFLSNTSWSD